jgi:hypothetical protein
MSTPLALPYDPSLVARGAWKPHAWSTADVTDNETAIEPIDPHRVITVAPVAVAAPGTEDCVVHNLETGATYRLNDVGAKVWELLEATSTIADITSAIRTEYRLPDDVTPQQVLDDVTKVIGDLHQYGLVILDDQR